jgi:hypothetical protein
MIKISQSIPPQLSRVGGIFISVFFFVSGVVALGGFVTMAVEMSQAKYWTFTEGVITDSYIVTTNVGRSSQQFLAVVQYQFDSGGETYNGDRLSFFNARETREEVARIKLAPYPTGTKIKVFYNPHNPNHSILILPTYQWVYFLFFIPLSILIITLGILLFKMSWHLR